MKLKLETQLDTKLLLAVIPISLWYTLIIFSLVIPIPNPLIFWLSFFLLWFNVGLFGTIWAEENEARLGIYALFVVILVIGIIISSAFNNSMLIVVEAHGGLTAGIAGAFMIYIVKRRIDVRRGLPVTVRIIYKTEKAALLAAGISEIIVSYILLLHYFGVQGLMTDVNSIYCWVFVILAILWIFFSA